MAANGISTLGDKEQKQTAKLTLATTNRGNSGRRNTLDITQLPTRYQVNAVVDNANRCGLVNGLSIKKI